MRSLPRTILAACTAAVLVTGLAGAPAVSAPERRAGSTEQTERASVRQLGVPVLPAALRAAGGFQPGRAQPYATLRSVGTRDYGMVGVTWQRHTGGSGVKVWVRTRTDHTWSRWTRLDVDDDGNGGTRWGTEGLWVGRADGVAAVVKTTSGRAPRDVRIVLVDPGARRVPASARTKKSPPSAASPSFTPPPAIITRAQWGAVPNTPCDSPQIAPRTLGVVLHHTAGANGYTAAQSAAIVRATQAFHMQGRGWCDVGYNFLVDKYGQIFEGRNGGADLMVRGAHAGNFDVNTYAAGISMMGNFDVARPSAALRRSVVRLVGWKLGTTYLNPRGRYALDGHTFARIEGHRDVYRSGIRPATSTACPGRYGYAWLNAKYGLRYQVTRYLAHYSTPPKRKYVALGRAVAGYVYAGEAVTAGGRKLVTTNGEILSKPGLGPAWWVTGAIRTKYDAAGAELGVFGFPTADATTTGTVTTQTFEHGSIAFDSATGVYTTTPVV